MSGLVKEVMNMDKNVAEKEIDYQLIKLLLINLQREGLLTAKEAEAIRKKAQADLKPIIGILDWGRWMKKIIHKIKVYPKVEKLYEPFYQKRRVAIYARVSTSSDEQLNSIEAQRDYYLKYVEERSDLIFVKLYADEGITGTSQKMRVEFQKMMSDAKSGAFDLIITKSISRFARNTVDSLICIRLLKEYGIEVYFQKDYI